MEYHRYSSLSGVKYAIFLSFINISPLVGISNPAIILNVVVLPHPEGPNRHTNSPSSIDRLTLSTAFTWLPLCENIFVKLLISSL